MIRTRPIDNPMKILPVSALAAFSFLPVSPAFAQILAVRDIAELDLEQLANVVVSSVSKRDEKLLDAPASIFVISSEDIRRSGATSLPEALRLAPNLQVARGDTSQYLVTARGGLAGTANKMLVLIDGRTVYTPLFSGVFWDEQIVVMEDIERIEVISGPGSTLWGTNAVNGVVNVTTKSATKTLGFMASGTAGNMERGGSVRMGSELPGGGAFRAYGRYYDRDAHQLGSGATAKDQADRWQAGMRADWENSQRAYTVQGDLYGGNIDNLGGVRPISGGHVIGRMRATLSPDSQLSGHVYYDRAEREHLGSFKEARDTFDVEVQQSMRPSKGTYLIVGGGYRATRDRTEATPALAFLPATRNLGLASLYVQGERELPGNVEVTVGLRAERNSYTGVEWLPNLRFSWSPSKDQVLWGALTRTVRSPSRIDRDLVVPGMPPYVVFANDTFESERADVADLGYRGTLARDLSFSITAFAHRFSDLRTIEPGGGGLVFANGAEGRARGVEGWADYRVTRDWRLVAGFVSLHNKFEVSPGRVDLGAPAHGNDPKITAQLRSSWNVTSVHEFDVTVRHMGELPSPLVKAYTVMDLRAGWRITPQVELSLVVTNAFDREHREFATANEGAVIGRATFLRATLRL